MKTNAPVRVIALVKGPMSPDRKPITYEKRECFLHGWFVEGVEGEHTVMGLVEVEDGSFQTVCCSHIKLVNPTKTTP